MARIGSSCNFTEGLRGAEGRLGRAAFLASVFMALACARTQHGAELQEEVGSQDKNSFASALVALIFALAPDALVLADAPEVARVRRRVRRLCRRAVPRGRGAVAQLGGREACRAMQFRRLSLRGSTKGWANFQTSPAQSAAAYSMSST
jgi:hypothetical protein